MLESSTTSETLIPPAVTATAERLKRLAGAFGPRFFLLLAIGLVWLGAAFRNPMFFYAMAAWDLLVVIAWVIDFINLPRAAQLTITRCWTSAAALSVATKIELRMENTNGRTVLALLTDNIPQELASAAPQIFLKCRARGEASGSYEVVPTQRGNSSLGAVYIRYQTPMRLAEAWAVARVEQTICVNPNLEEARQQSLYLVRSRQIEMEKRHTRIRGAGREFESLREYYDGDEFRDICWTATARRGKLVTRQFQIERSQTIWLVLDSGRLMRARIAGLTKLDYAVNAALCLSEVALGTGDRVGLLAYGRHIQKRVLPYRGSAHLRQLIRQLSQVKEEPLEADHLQALSSLLSTQKRRSLIVWITDFPETAMTPEVIEAASEAASRHLVLFVVIGQPDLAKLAEAEPESVTAMYRSTAAQETVHRREVLLAKLRQRGALAVEVSSAKTAVTVINSYLEIKQRSLL